MEKWTQIGLEFNLEPEPGYFGHMGPDYVLLTDRRFIVPSVRLTYSKVPDFKILSVEDNLSEIVVTIDNGFQTTTLVFKCFTLVRGTSSHL